MCALVAVSALVSAQAVAAPGEDSIPIDNPNLSVACGIDIEVVLDRSGSIANAGATGDVKRAFSAFTNALKNTGSRIAVADFSTTAQLPIGPNYITVTDATIASTFNPYINAFNPSGRTHWEDGFRMGRYFQPRPSQATPHLVVFITDGDPNQVIRTDRVTYDPGNPNVAQNEYELKVPLSSDEQAQANEDTAKNRAVSNANALKTQGSHILTIAVGAGLNSQSSLDRIIDISGPDVYAGTGTFDISTTDVYREPDFSQLEAALRAAAFQLCAPSVNVRKLVDQNPDPAVDDLQPGQGWEMEAVVSPEPGVWVLPAGAAGTTATTDTGPDGFANFQWNTTTPVTSDITVTETPQPGYENDPSATTCTYRTPDTAADQPLPGFSATTDGFSGSVPDDSIVTCQMVNRIPPEASIQLEKSTNGDDADAITGPFVPIGAPVTWEYEVTNTGNVPLAQVAVTDDQIGAITCSTTSLAPAETTTCTATGTATAGQYTNEGTVTASSAVGPVTDSDPSHYFGAAPGIDIEKATNGADADNEPGPLVPVGGAVNWTYVVTNTGNDTLTGIAVTDDVLGAITCPQTTLAPTVSMTCTAGPGTAISGQYENTASVVGTGTGGATVQDSDVSHYYGMDPDVEIQKFTNGADANTPTGPLVAVGGDVTWRYEITNTGNVPLTSWQPTDSQGVGVGCPRLFILRAGESVTCTGGGTAVAGQYANTATVSAVNLLNPQGPPVTDSDPSHYFGVQGQITLEKLTNGEDADEAPGPFVPVGGAVDWIYRVTNTGNAALEELTVADSKGVTIDCPQSTLAVGESIDCTGAGTAEIGQYTNFSGARAFTPLNTPVFAFDPSHYFGASPGIHVEKSTNGVDADDPAEAVYIPVGAVVDWTYVVTNSGNDALNGVSVTDSEGVTVTCPQTSLAVNEAMTCTGSGTATLGEYENTATASGTDTTGDEVTDDDPSHYFGYVSRIEVQKSTNGEDADTPTGPKVPAGGAVTWTYVVTNPGNIGITNVQVSDDRGLTPVYQAGDTNANTELDPGEIWTYQASGTAVPGQYANTATATGVDVLEEPLSSTDPSHYIADAIVPPFTPVQPNRPLRPALRLVKKATPRRVEAGERVRFRIQVRNAGRGTARRVRVCDQLPSGLAYVSVKGARIRGGRACFSIRVLRPRARKSFTVLTRALDRRSPARICNTAASTAQRARLRRDRACIRVTPAVRQPPAVTG